MFQTSYVFRTFHPPFSSLLPHPLGDTPLPPVLIAPLFAIFVLREALSVVTRERKKEKKGRRGKRRKKKNLFTTISSPFILATSLWRALRHRFSDALHLFIGTRAGLLSLSLSLFFEFVLLYSPRSLCFECGCKRAAPSLSCQECNFCDDFSSKNEYRSFNLFI